MRLLTLSLLVAGALGITACGGGSSREAAKVEQALARVQRSTGRSIDDVRCQPYRNVHAKGFRWSCQTHYTAGDTQTCQTVDPVHGKLPVIGCDEHRGDTYPDCLKHKSVSFCKREANRRLRACIDVPRDRPSCRESIYGSVNRAPAELPRPPWKTPPQRRPPG
jgi:hypothetical protein